MIEAATASPTKKRSLLQDQHERAHKHRKTDAAGSASSLEAARSSKIPAKFAGHSKKERKQNRSTRIHSIRKLLGRDTLPSTIRQEKERELAALLHEQNANRSKKEGRKVLEKYHYVRFVERQKAEKKLRQLRRQLDGLEGEDNDDGQRARLNRQIHEMEVHRNYAIYAPLSQKYISIFVQSGNGDVSEDQSQANDSKPREMPPLWYVVESAMKQGEKELELLRDGKSKLLRQGNNTETKVNKVKISGDARTRPGRLSDKKPVAQQASPSQDRSDESDASDDDFFER